MTADPRRPFVADDPHDPPQPVPAPADACTLCHGASGLRKRGRHVVCAECIVAHGPKVASLPRLPVRLTDALGAVRDLVKIADAAVSDHADLVAEWQGVGAEDRIAIAGVAPGLVDRLNSVAGRWGEWETL